MGPATELQNSSEEGRLDSVTKLRTAAKKVTYAELSERAAHSSEDDRLNSATELQTAAKKVA